MNFIDIFYIKHKRPAKSIQNHFMMVEGWLLYKTLYFMTKKQKPEKRPENKNTEKHHGFTNSWAFIILVCLVLPLSFRSVFYAPFHIPSGSMKSSLLVGDFIFVSKNEYGLSRYSFPLGFKIDYFDGRMGGHLPERGDVIVFRPPPTPGIDFIKRLVGLPGDKIRMFSGRLYINGKLVPQERIEDFIDEDESGSVKRMEQYIETLPGGVSHLVLDDRKDGDLDNFDEVTVPEGHYFFMGDNRDNSSDSRTKVVGFVPLENIVGKAKIVAFSNSSSLFTPWEWFASFRGDRLWLSMKDAETLKPNSKNAD